MRKVVDRVVLNAERDAKAARARLMGTTTELRHRLDPRVLAAEGAESLADRAQALVHAAGTTAKARPYASAGGLAAFVAAVGFRYWIGRRKTASEATDSALDR